MAQMMKRNPPAMQETWVRSLGWEDPLEEDMATHSSFLAWKIPWTEQSGWLYSPWGCKESNVNEHEYEHKVYTSRLLLLLSRFSHV